MTAQSTPMEQKQARIDMQLKSLGCTSQVSLALVLKEEEFVVSRVCMTFYFD